MGQRWGDHAHNFENVQQNFELQPWVGKCGLHSNLMRYQWSIAVRRLLPSTRDARFRIRGSAQDHACSLIVVSRLIYKHSFLIHILNEIWRLKDPPMYHIARLNNMTMNGKIVFRNPCLRFNRVTPQINWKLVNYIHLQEPELSELYCLTSASSVACSVAAPRLCRARWTMTRSLWVVVLLLSLAVELLLLLSDRQDLQTMKQINSNFVVLKVLQIFALSQLQTVLLFY